ncbi:hypothetical protein G9A89_005714 [Geosiphon pyriformis]|nr:hypothetical protein G9A89_005714 [Geosiphon pyriformis]
MCGHFKPITMPSAPLIEFDNEEKKPTWKAYQIFWANDDYNKKKDIPKETDDNIETSEPPYIPLKYKDCKKKLSFMELGLYKANRTMNYVLLVANNYWTKECGITFLDEKEHHQEITCLDSYSHDKNQIWKIINAKVEGTTSSKILEIKNNPPKPVNCDLIYNPPSHIIYTILKEEKPISSCTSESELTFNPNSNFDNDNNNNKNNGFSSAQYDNKNNNNSDSDSNSETYIVLFDLSKEQKLRWFSNNSEGIMPEYVHNTDARFDLRYPRKNTIKLEPHSCICIDLKVALEISATTIVQLAFRNSLVKKEINIRRGIIDTEYVRNIIAILQNDSKKTYIIKPNKKITQAIFLFLVKIAQLVLVRNKEELEITVRGIQGFRSTDRIDIPVNMAEEEIDQIQIFETKATLCESRKIGLVNLYISAKNHRHIKIPIYNNMGDTIEIPERTTIGYLITEIENQLPNTILNFLQLCRYLRRMLSALTRTIETDELGKSKPIIMYAA